MENKKIVISFLISFLLHMAVFLYFKPEITEKKDKKLTYVDIIEKTKEKKIEKDFKPDILSDKDLNLEKKTDTKDSNKIEKKIASIPKTVPRQIVPALPKEPTKEEKSHKREELKEDTGIEKKVDTGKIETQEKKEESKEVVNKQMGIEDIDKKQKQQILNPKEIIKEIAENEEAASKEGEDVVNFKSMKFKYASYFYKFKKSLYNVWTYPATSIYNREQGTVRIQFTILEDGTITNINIVRSSGYPDLDREAVRALKTMGKVPLSESFSIKQLHVDGYFTYEIGFVGRYIY
jgi:protein TonB